MLFLDSKKRRKAVKPSVTTRNKVKYTLETRMQAVAAVLAGESASTVAERYGIASRQMVYKWKN